MNLFVEKIVQRLFRWVRKHLQCFVANLFRYSGHLIPNFIRIGQVAWKLWQKIGIPVLTFYRDTVYFQLEKASCCRLTSTVSLYL